MNAVVDENRMHLVGDGGDETSQEVGGHPGGCLFVDFDEGELGRTANSHEKMELSLFGAAFGDVDVKNADRGFELARGRFVAVRLRQSPNSMASCSDAGTRALDAE